MVNMLKLFVEDMRFTYKETIILNPLYTLYKWFKKL